MVHEAPFLTRLLPISLTLVTLLFSTTLLALWFFAPIEIIEWTARAMKANASVCFVSASLALLLRICARQNPRASLAASILAGIAVAIALSTLFQYAFGLHFGIDELIRADYPNEESSIFPGRMAPNTAVLYFLLGSALLLMDRPQRRDFYISDYILLTICTLSGVALVGYLYQFNLLYKVADYIRMSEYSALSFVALSVAAAFARPEHRAIRLFVSPGPEGALARRTIPTTILFPIFMCWLVSWLREDELLNRPTAFALLATSHVVVFSTLILFTARALGRTERERVRLFEQEKRVLSTINEVGKNLVGELELEKLVQAVTDAARLLSGAQFGAFFYTVVNQKNESFLLYTISGVPREAFSKFPMPRNTAVFAPTFEGTATVRSDDITKDPRYGKSAPYHGMPIGHLPVRSYLAVPVITREGKVLGGLFFGHSSVAVFSEASEQIVEGLAAQAAVAMDNAKLYQQLQNSLRARDEFLSIASHELRTPLTTLKLQSQTRERWLKRGDMNRFTPDSLVDMFRTDDKQVTRLTRLVDDMLDIGRIATGKLTINFERADLNALTGEVIARLRTEFDHRHTPLNFRPSEGLFVNCDRDRIEQVLMNLLTNTLKYGQGKPVEVRLSRVGDRAMLAVQDGGIGIAQENHLRIFERFERAVTASEISGLGLGLYIVKQIMALHNGSIAVESELGHGATFTVEMPIA